MFLPPEEKAEFQILVDKYQVSFFLNAFFSYQKNKQTNKQNKNKNKEKNRLLLVSNLLRQRSDYVIQ